MGIRASAAAVAVVLALTGCAVVRRASLAPGGIGEPNGASVEPARSTDGSITAFASTASNLVPGDTNGVSDVFVRDANGVVARERRVERHPGKRSELTPEYVRQRQPAHSRWPRSRTPTRRSTTSSPE